MIILASAHWRKINGINFSHYETYKYMYMYIKKYDWTISNKLWSLVNTIVEHCIILMQLLIISSLKSISRYVSYHEASMVICIVSWGECIVAALAFNLAIFRQLHLVSDGGKVYIVKSTPLRAFTGSFQRFEDMLQTYWRCTWRSLMPKNNLFNTLAGLLTVYSHFTMTALSK